MNKKVTKLIGINVKFCVALILNVVIASTILLVCLVPRYTGLVTDTTTTGMSDYASIYTQLIDTSLNSMASAMRNSRPMLEIGDNESSEDTESTENNSQAEGDTQADGENAEAQGGPGGGPAFSGTRALSNLMEEYKDYVNIMCYADLNGTVLYSTDDSLVGNSISSERYFQSVAGGSSYAMGPASVTETGTEFIFAFSAINSDGELTGVITANFSSSYLGHILSPADAEPLYSEAGMQLISGVSLFGVSGATVYVSDENGIVLTASDELWVGFDTDGEENDSIYDESKEETGYSKYEDEGDSFYMSYSYIAEGDWLFIVDIPHDEIFASLNQMYRTIALIAVVLLIFAAISSYVISSGITKPIKKTTESLEYLSNLELNKIDLTEVKRNNDETGIMLNSIELAVAQIKKVIASIEASSDHVYTNAKRLSSISEQLQSNATENSQVAEELSAGMEETASTQDNISRDIIVIQDSSSAITNRIQDGVASCDQIITAADTLNRETEQASEVTKGIYNDVKDDVAKALERAKAVEKINLMTNSIMDIASQTSLLALNASIEAARAGDAGRGFAIVAEQIGMLANQSSDTVSDISSIIEEVNGAVTDMTTSLEKTLNFMESQVLNDYAKFINVSNQYSDQSNHLRTDMSEIAESIKNFMSTLQSMSESIKETALTLDVASENTVSLTEKNNQVAAIAVDTNEMAQESTQSAEQLNEILKVFKL